MRMYESLEKRVLFPNSILDNCRDFLGNLPLLSFSVVFFAHNPAIFLDDKVSNLVQTNVVYFKPVQF